MIRMHVQLEDKNHDEFIKVLLLTQPKRGHTLTSIGKSINAYFGKEYRIEMVMNKTHHGVELFSPRESYIQTQSQKIHFMDLVLSLEKDNHIRAEQVSIKAGDGKSYPKKFYKVVDKFESFN